VYILDTNTLGEKLRYGRQTILGRRLAAVSDPRTNLRITIVTAEEMLAGRILDLNRDPKKVPRLEPLHTRYRLLQETYDALMDYRPLPFDEAAQAIYESIPKNIRDNAKARDCRIAAIAVANNHTVITANTKDFARIQTAIPVKFVDWTVALPEELGNTI
jgi:predicted nucleic acid-binding protein